MKLKLVLLSLLCSCGILSAQDTIKSLLITESRMDRGDHTYCEITNMGTETINLKDFEFGCIRPWADPWTPEADHSFMLPDHELAPGASYVIAVISDWNAEQYYKEVAKFEYSPHGYTLFKPEMTKLADLQIHRPESPTGDPTDSITQPYHWIMDDIWNGRECWYLRHHFLKPDTAHPGEFLPDSAVIDQVGGVFDVNGRNSDAGAYDVAGVTGATANCVLVRKHVVTEAPRQSTSPYVIFDQGNDIKDSEWMPIPFLSGQWEPDRAVFWTVGNHGAYNLDENSLIPKSPDADINWGYSVIKVPFGARRDDSIMNQFERKPGIAWHYDYAASHDDSAYVSVRPGDQLTVWVCGDDLDTRIFTMQPLPPSVDANIVIPLRHKASQPAGEDFWTGAYTPYIVTKDQPGMDTIKNVFYGTRIDTLLLYLEKAPNATWEIVPVDEDETRADLKMGDVLRVTAESGAVKDYYIHTFRYRKSQNAYVASITWPDIPEYYKGIFGWIGDTIPNFSRSVYNYKVTVPFDVAGIPALLAKPEDINAHMVVDRARNLSGTVEDKTATFTSTAEDDSTVLVYKVQLEKEKNPTDVQPWKADPIISEFIFWEQWTNGFVEIVNPGTVSLDLSDYMFFGQWNTDPAGAISSFAETDSATWLNRYVKYIPGYKWVSWENWQTTPARVVQDLAVNPIVYPGDVFVMSGIFGKGTSYSSSSNNPWRYGVNWPAEAQADVIFHNTGNMPPPNSTTPSPISTWNEPTNESCARQWTGADFYIYRILNDSIKDGTKAATDPNDFQLVETFGNADGSGWDPCGTAIDMITTCIRKPEFYLPKPGFSESFANTADSSEWITKDRPYYDARNVPWPADILRTVEDLGQHFMNEVTVYKSTVGSTVYKVSAGYITPQQIKGMVTGTVVDDFLANLILADTIQTLTVKSASTGNVLAGTDALTNGDTLIVTSGEFAEWTEIGGKDTIVTKSNTTKYILEVTAEGLSHDAALTSTVYTIAIDGSTGTVSGMPYGTLLKDVVENVTVPQFATMTVVDGNDEWVQLKKLNFDTLYVDVQVTDAYFLEVLAEDGVTKILYQIVPTAVSSDAFVTSDVFMVNQSLSLIDYIPQGTTVQGFLANLIPVTGATVKILDKNGLERSIGELYKDDKLVVTSQDETNVKVYYLSMLPAWEGETADYLAYVTSSVYTVNQYTLNISSTSITGATTVATLLGNLVPSTGATIKVVDAMDVENTGTVNIGDLVKVTAANGIVTAYYTIEVNTSSVDEMGSIAINIYPNPSSGLINVSGLVPGYRIRIINILGSTLRDMVTTQSDEIISLENQPEGVYFVIVSNGDSVIGRYKLIIK
jgi:hypothetical protein